MGCSESKPEVRNTKRLSSSSNKQALDADLERMKEEAARNSQEHKDSRGFMVNSEKEAARLDSPLSEGLNENGTMWYKYADKRIKHVHTNGDLTITYASGEIKNYQEVGGIKTTKYRDGGKKNVFVDGTTVKTEADGSEKQTNPDGSHMEKSANGHEMHTLASGATREICANDELMEIDFPLGPSPGGEELKWPKIKTIEKPAEGAASATHYKAADGTNIQRNADGNLIVNWKPGHVKEADAHYGAEPWMMSVTPDGENVYIKNRIPDDWCERDAEARLKEAEALIPAGEPIQSGKSEDGTFTWYKYADKSVKRVLENGDLQIEYDSSSTIEKYSEEGGKKTICYRTGKREVVFPGGVRLEVDPDGRKKQTEINGDCTTTYGEDSDMEKFTEAAGQKIAIYRDGGQKIFFDNGNTKMIGADGTIHETNKDGVVRITSANNHVVDTRPDGASKETAPDNELIEIDFPLGLTPGGKPLVWPKIKTIQRPPTASSGATHYKAIDGTSIQANSDGSKLVEWVPGHDPEADEHYLRIKCLEGTQENSWCMRVNPDGSTNYMLKERANANWTEDSYDLWGC